LIFVFTVKQSPNEIIRELFLTLFANIQILIGFLGSGCGEVVLFCSGRFLSMYVAIENGKRLLSFAGNYRYKVIEHRTRRKKHAKSSDRDNGSALGFPAERAS
jgi:hypothetical protein